MLILLSHIGGDVPTTGVKFFWRVLDGSGVGWNLALELLTHARYSDAIFPGTEPISEKKISDHVCDL
ncbi:MAG: hypothetical protein IPL32_10130 [Chloracidobacterium sp.]|nr:hypothetical protein [Chloracidobacterium sp.]